MKKVKEIMTSPVCYCSKYEKLHIVADLMAKNNIGSLPVVDSNKMVIGIVTDRDVCLALGKDGTQKTSELTVQDAMSTEIHTCAPEDDVTTALKTMRSKQIGHLPVVDDQQELKGIITLMSVVKKTHGRKEEAEIEYAGEENIIKTLYALAERDSKEYAKI